MGNIEGGGRDNRETIADHTSRTVPALRRRQGAYLPHLERIGGTYAVTFRLADSLPRHVQEEYAERRQELRRAIYRLSALGGEAPQPAGGDEFRVPHPSLPWLHRARLEGQLMEWLDEALGAGYGECVLRRSTCAGIVRDSLSHFEGVRYDTVAWCVMPNHVHVVVTPGKGVLLASLLRSWKTYTARRINEHLGRTGALWQPEYYDHLIRSEEERAHAIAYVLRNPEKAGLRDWPWVGARSGAVSAFGRQMG